MFLPLKFIQNVIDYLLQSEKITDQYCADIRIHVQKTFAILEENLDDSITQVSDCSSIHKETDQAIFSIMVKADGSDEWNEGEYVIEDNQINTNQLTIKLSQIENFKQSKNILILLVQTTDSNFFALKFVSEEEKEFFMEKIDQL